MKIIVVVDMQNDFCKEGGLLSSSNTIGVIPKVVKVIEKYNKDKENCFIFTKDTHDVGYYATHEGKFIPFHCLKNTIGEEFVNELIDYAFLKVIIF